MGIRLVYGLDTDDLSYLGEFYPSRRLAGAAIALGLDYAATIHPRNGNLETTIRFCLGHLALLRGELPMDLFDSLEAAGVTVVNSASSTALARDKAASAGFFLAIGASHPETTIVNPSSRTHPLPFPFVLKPRYGKMGRGMALVTNAAEWARNRPDDLSDYVAQDYIEASRGRDVRFFFAGFGIAGSAGDRQATTSVAVLRQGPGLASNAHAGGVMEVFEAPPSLQAEAGRIFAASGLTYGTVDFLFADRSGSSFTVCEINSCPGFEEFERVTGLDAARAILSSAIAGTASATGTVAKSSHGFPDQARERA